MFRSNAPATRRRSILLVTTALAALTASAAAENTAQDGRWTAGASSSEEVIVTGQRSITAPNASTATRTDTPIEKVPQSIQVLTRKLIQDQDLRTASDALVNVSGVVPMGTLQTILQAPIVRGFPVNYFFDGLPAYQLPPGVADPATLVNVSRIEVAKGPTSTLYGGGSGAPLSGLLNIVSLDPASTFGGSISVRGGSFSTYGADGDVSVPLGATAGLRISGMLESAESYIDKVSSDRYGIFPTLAVEITPDTRLVVRARYNHLEQTEYAGLPAEVVIAPDLGVDRFTYAGASDAPRNEIENTHLSASLAHAFTDRISANLTLAYLDSAYEEWGAFTYGQIAGTIFNMGNAYLPSDTQKAFVTASATFGFDTGNAKHTLLIGVDYDKTDYFGAMYFNTSIGTVDLASSNPTLPFGPIPPLFFDQVDTLETIALFAQDQIAIGDRLDVTLGARWTKLDVNSVTAGIETDDTAYRLTPRIGATYRIADGVSLFAGYAEGFQGLVGYGFYGFTPEPETSQAYEAGLKFAAPIEGLSGTVAFYRITRQNVATPDPANPFLYVQTGEQRAQGVELDLVYEPTKNLSLLASYAFTDAEITEDNNLPVGDQLRAVPRHSGRLAARYRFDDDMSDGLEIGAGLTAVSSRELTMPNTISVDGSVLLDLQVAYDFGPASLGLSVVNVTDEDAYAPYQYFGFAIVQPVQPLSAFVSIKADF